MAPPDARRGRPRTPKERPTGSPRALQARLAGILDIADDAIIAVDDQQRITLFNQGAEKIFGYHAQEVLGQLLDLLLPARFVAPHQQHLAEFAISADTARRMGERRDIYGRRKDGGEFPAEASISKLDLDGALTFTVILRDITARKRYEHELQEKNAELERAMLAKDRFLSSMSHELRTPLNAIIGFTGTLLMRLPGPLTADQEKQLTTVQSSARHLLALINDLLDLAKIDSGKVELRLEPVDCREALREVAAGLRPLAEQRGLNLEIGVPRHALVALADRRALSQILINLAGNAIKFTERGKVTIEVAREHVTAEDRGSKIEDSSVGVDDGRSSIFDPRSSDTTASDGHRTSTVVFRVSDTGSGIRPEDQERLFEAFARGAAAARPSEGAGLGLYLSQKLAALLGARIEFQSVYGQGSTFALVLPER